MIYSKDTDPQRYYANRHQILQRYCGDVRFSEEQLKVIRMGLEKGDDISVYANPEIPAEIMENIYNSMRGQKHYNVRYYDPDGNKKLQLVTAWSKSDALCKFFLTTTEVRDVIEIQDGVDQHEISYEQRRTIYL